jgi:integrase
MSIVVKQYKDTDQWLVDIRIKLPSGKVVRERRTSKLTSKSATQRWAEQRERALFDEHTAPAANGRKLGPTVGEYVPKYIGYCTANRQKPSTLRGKRDMLNAWIVPRLASKRLGEISATDFADLKAALTESGAGASHGNNVMRVLTNMLRMAVELGLIDGLPVMKAFKRTTVERPYYEPEQVDALCNAAADEQLVMVLLGAHAGLRAGEIIGLEWTDIDFARNTIHVQRAVWEGHVGLPKHDRKRRVPMTVRLATALKELRHLRGPRVLYRAGKALDARDQVSGWLTDIERAAGFEPRGCVHALRHSFCSNLAAAGVPVKAIATLAGHGHISTTQRYMHLAPGATDAAVLVLERVTPLAAGTGNSVTA